MPIHRIKLILVAAMAVGLVAQQARAADAPAAPPNAATSASRTRIVEALQNILALQRPGQDGYATIWDGNKFVQCQAMADHSLRCEAAGGRMQPSLRRLVSGGRLARLQALGWAPNLAFGDYVQAFEPRTPPAETADLIMTTLSEAYDADLANLEVETRWLPSEPCPPRNGPSQNLAGMISDAPSMQPTAVHACFYVPEPDHAVAATSVGDLMIVYGERMTAEIQRIRVNRARGVHVIFDADIGYVQCEPQDAPAAIYCEAESIDEWPALASVLTPDRIDRLHALGYADPGRAPNYWKAYPLDHASDGEIAAELLTVLHDAYGYTGAQALEVTTEEGKQP